MLDTDSGVLVNTELRERVETLRADYESCTDQPWNYFLCPILFRDEEAQLCRAHVINKAFQDSDRSWTVQRADVDSRFGTLFEKDFLAIERGVNSGLMRCWRTRSLLGNST